MAKAELKNYRHSPRKVRLVVNAIRGKKVNEAVDVLNFMTKKASDPIQKLLKSAIANAEHNFKIDADSLFVKEISVNKGTTLHRWMPKARGSASRINKRSSHVKIILDTKNPISPKESTKDETVVSASKSDKKPAKVKKVNKDKK